MYEQKNPQQNAELPAREARPLPEAFDELLDKLSQAAEKRRVLNKRGED
ncbi:hypothetical protein [Flavimaricola marinus]|uniref:Uncharacterized protein n=1 Tax=Flavimaricola marinus TaxID=1819565 RepID=A0A238LJV0_9RHOB|nr:hypothetical protein [Flavimaricola marinus]SMY09665.1 hypothetical protein LOM8899_03837 [Flavimaricola marinus]